MVRSDGIEGTLSALFRAGVYITVDEFKGRSIATRGSSVVTVDPDRLRNPNAEFHFRARSGGTRSGGTPILMDLAFIRGCGVNAMLTLAARGGSNWLKSTWETPGAGARFRLLEMSSFGAPPVRWFTQVDPSTKAIDPMFRWSERAMRWGSRLASVPLPPPVFAPLSDPTPIAQWIKSVRATGQVPFIFTFPSSAVRLCHAAIEHGLDISGTQFTLSGEPITDARLEVIRNAGATALPRYGSMECGPIGYGCLNPSAADDVHLQHDLHAIIQPGDNPTLPSNAVLITSLHPASPFIMLNVSMGDSASLNQRQCGCEMEQLGFATHMSEVRSFEKLTAGGMTFFDSDVVRVLEEVLPRRFGGKPTHYQLVEESSSTGEPRLRLAIDPSVGPLDDGVVVDTFIESISMNSPVNRMMGAMWKQSGFINVVRETPTATRAGKIQHIHARVIS
jgi:hypothetical protein